MKIDIPIEIGDPVIKIEFNQHDGYYIEYAGFDYDMINKYNQGLIFTKYAGAEAYVNKCNERKFGKVCEKYGI